VFVFGAVSAFASDDSTEGCTFYNEDEGVTGTCQAVWTTRHEKLLGIVGC
jgi:hypothetical protein